MASSSQYFNQVTLLIKVLPYVFNEGCFCLKGGTAINLFIRDLPRLSVDIDLVYTGLEDRHLASEQISFALERIKNSINNSGIRDSRVHTKVNKDGFIDKLFVQHNNVHVKIEPNFILRGVLFPVGRMRLTKSAESTFGLSLSDIPVLNIAEIYAGKICAALDRQHPRDLFDVKLLYENEGITREIVQSFVIYLASHNGAMHELLNPNMQDIASIFNQEFLGMTNSSVELEDLLRVRDRLVSDVRSNLTDNDKEFLVSIKSCKPRYDLMPFENLHLMPALKWKLHNIHRMEYAKRQEQMDLLKRVLYNS